MKRTATLLVLMMFLVVSVQAGVQWTAKITSGGDKVKDNVMMSTVSAQDGNFRQEFSNVSKQQRNQYVEDGYWLYKSKERMLYIVDNKKKSVTPMSLDSLQQMLQALGPMVRMEIEDVKVRVEKLGGATLLGFPCTHVKIYRSYTMKMKITVIKKTIRMEEEQEIWGSTAVPAYASLQGEFINRGFKTGWEDLDKMVEKQAGVMKGLGFPLKTITRSKQFNKKGKLKGETLTTMEVEKIGQKSFPADFFNVPKDYQVEENPVMSGGEDETPKKKKKFKLF